MLSFIENSGKILYLNKITVEVLPQENVVLIS